MVEGKRNLIKSLLPVGYDMDFVVHATTPKSFFNQALVIYVVLYHENNMPLPFHFEIIVPFTSACMKTFRTIK
ncbi:MAG: hypothetical protein JWM16_257 [Verrucomicrobiales bacterium]|nr:hypothetical protein [Verrucomicrobiales bacterium]